jgi:hypothetical protein
VYAKHVAKHGESLASNQITILMEVAAKDILKQTKMLMKATQLI